MIDSRWRNVATVVASVIVMLFGEFILFYSRAIIRALGVWVHIYITGLTEIFRKFLFTSVYKTVMIWVSYNGADFHCVFASTSRYTAL